MIKVLEPGLQTTVQDQGRDGYYQIGLPPTGALDNYSYTVANLLVGNDRNAGALEFAYMGPALEFQEQAIIAITGGEIPPKLNEEPIPMWQSIMVNKGDILSFDFLKKGVRTYIAFRGGIDVPIVLGSRSTHLMNGMGGYEGRALQKGDTLKLGSEMNGYRTQDIQLPKKYIPEYPNCYEIRVLLGLNHYRVMEDSVDKFFSIDWSVTPEVDRVACRLTGGKLDFVPREVPFGAGDDPSNVVHMPNPFGAIQIPGGIEPTVLFRDACATGFATIGAAISVDLCKMAQVKHRDKIKFTSVTIEEALQAVKDYKKTLVEIEDIIK